MTETVDILLPEDQREGTESILASWLKKVGDAVKQHEPIAEISTDKVSVELSSPATGILTEILKKESDSIEHGEVIGRIELKELADVSAPAQKCHKAPVESNAGQADAAQRLSPAVRKLVAQHNLDLALIEGSGAGGRITADDVQRFLDAQTISSPGSKSEDALASQRVPHSPMRKSIASRMLKSVTTAPHVTSFFEVNLSAVLKDKKERQEILKQKGLPLTLTAYFVFAAVEALKHVPEVNSRWHDDYLEVFSEINIGIGTAVDSNGESGLIVPVIKNAQNLDLAGMAKEISELTEKARKSELSREKVSGSTFTISNHGMTGSLMAAPIIINQPESAILGIGKLEKRAVVSGDKDQITVQPMIYVTLTIDHRVLDGFKANKFLSTFKEKLEGWQ
jgi:2-oxoglutarate dehydrogenase E2 component (dihydrolipoamide succinyltransferase)